MTGLWIDRLVPETVRIHQGSETTVVAAAALGRLRAEDEHVAGDAEAARAGRESVAFQGTHRLGEHLLAHAWDLATEQVALACARYEARDVAVAEIAKAFGVGRGIIYRALQQVWRAGPRHGAGLSGWVMVG
jgi:hypothetical protein